MFNFGLDTLHSPTEQTVFFICCTSHEIISGVFPPKKFNHLIAIKEKEVNIKACMDCY